MRRSDIVESKRIQQALNQCEERYRRLFEISIAGFCVATVDGIVFECNEAFARALGYASPGDVRGQAILDLVVGSAEERAALQARIRVDRRAALDEVRVRRKDGTAAWVAASAAVLDDAEGQEPLVYIAVIDINDRKVLELQLRQAQRMEAVGQLARGVAHDFNTLLKIVLAYTDALMATERDGRPARALAAIQRSAERAAMLTRQMLAFTQQHAWSPRVLDVNAVIETAEGPLRRAIGDQIALTIDCGRDLWYVSADPGQLELVVVNLVVALRDAIPPGGALRLSTSNAVVDKRFARGHPGARTGGFVRLSVADADGARDQEPKTRTLEPLSAADGTGKGAGLGLSTVRAIVSQGGGQGWITREDGRMTAIDVYLPRADEPLSDTEATRG